MGNALDAHLGVALSDVVDCCVFPVIVVSLLGTVFVGILFAPTFLCIAVLLLHPLPERYSFLITGERCLLCLVVPTAGVHSIPRSLPFSLLRFELRNVNDLDSLLHIGIKWVQQVKSRCSPDTALSSQIDNGNMWTGLYVAVSGWIVVWVFFREFSFSHGKREYTKY
jgi:hypothetical protein